MRQALDYELAILLTERVSLHKQDGRLFGGIAARVSPDTIFILDASLPIEVGDRIVRLLPNGLKDEFVVDDPRFVAQIAGSPDHFQARVHRLSASDQHIEHPVPDGVNTAPFGAAARVEAFPDHKRKERRRASLKQYRVKNGLQTENDLSRHLGMSTTAIQGIVRGDTKRYGPDTLLVFLKKIGVSPEDW